MIRIAAEEDAAELLEIYRPYAENTAITFEYACPSEDEFRERIRHTLAFYPYLTEERDGAIVGYAYAGAFQKRAAYRWSAETSIYVRQDAHGEGIGRELYAALEKAMQLQGIRNAEACIAAPRGEDPYLTDNSIGFHGHLGYRMVGRFERCAYKFHRWYDMIWMEKWIGDHPELPECTPDVCSFAQRREAFEAWTQAAGPCRGHTTSGKRTHLWS